MRIVTRVRGRLSSVIGAFIAIAVFNVTARAQTPTWYAGDVTLLEIWRTGNVAFKIGGVTIPCNGQFVLNKSDPGTKNLYAGLVAAKLAGKSVTVYFDVCGPAEGYGGNYAQVAYLYLN